MLSVALVIFRYEFYKKTLDLLNNLVYQRLRSLIETVICRGIAQLVEHRSPKPRVVSSNLTAPANKKAVLFRAVFFV